MHKADFEMLAASIHATKLDTSDVLGSGSVLKLVAERVASGIEDKAPAFDRERFLKACGFPTAVKVTVLGPNLRDQSKGTFHVHAEGCADIRHYGPGSRYGGEDKGWTIPVSSCVEVVHATYADQLDEAGGDPDETAREWLSDFHFAPCLAGLPTEAPVPEAVS